MGKSSSTITIEVLECLKDNGVDIKDIVLMGNILLKEVQQPNININAIIRKNGLNPQYKIGVKLIALIEAYNGNRKKTLTDEEKIRVEQLEILENNEIEQRRKIQKFIEILEILKENGIIFGMLENSFEEKGRFKSFQLKQISQPRINIQKIIKNNDLDPDLNIGYILNMLNDSYKRKIINSMKEEERDRIDNLGIIIGDSVEIRNFLTISEILKSNGVDLSYIKMENNKKYTLLKEINQPGIDISKIIEEYSLDPNFKIGFEMKKLRQKYRIRITQGNKRRIKSLGILKRKYVKERRKIYVSTEKLKLKEKENNLFERKSSIEKTFDILDTLVENGVDVSKIPMIVRRDGIRRGFFLKEIDQPGINIMGIIDKNNLNPEENIGVQIANINQSFKGTGFCVISEEGKRKAEDMGIIRNKLSKKEKEQQRLLEKAREAKKLRDDTKILAEENEHIDW